MTNTKLHRRIKKKKKKPRERYKKTGKVYDCCFSVRGASPTLDSERLRARRKQNGHRIFYSISITVLQPCHDATATPIRPRLAPPPYQPHTIPIPTPVPPFERSPSFPKQRNKHSSMFISLWMKRSLAGSRMRSCQFLLLIFHLLSRVGYL